MFILFGVLLSTFAMSASVTQKTDVNVKVKVEKDKSYKKIVKKVEEIDKKVSEMKPVQKLPATGSGAAGFALAAGSSALTALGLFGKFF